jgi:hypothetical protein
MGFYRNVNNLFFNYFVPYIPKKKSARENLINDLFRLKTIILHRDTLKIDMQ